MSATRANWRTPPSLSSSEATFIRSIDGSWTPHRSSPATRRIRSPSTSPAVCTRLSPVALILSAKRRHSGWARSSSTRPRAMTRLSAALRLVTASAVAGRGALGAARSSARAFCLAALFWATRRRFSRSAMRSWRWSTHRSSFTTCLSFSLLADGWEARAYPITAVDKKGWRRALGQASQPSPGEPAAGRNCSLNGV